jgi:hypothetical protein
MSGKAIRPWCAKMQYEGKEEFLIGTFVCSNSAPQNTIEESLWELVDSLLPTRPRLINLIAGQIFFIPESEKERMVGPLKMDDNA